MSELDLDILTMLGKLTKEIRREVSQLVKSGVDITEIIDFIECRIFKEGFLPSFPAMVSVNDMAAHYTVYDKGYFLKSGDVVKVDFGISHKGFITDNAFTVEIDTNKHEKLIETARECLEVALDTADFYVKMAKIGGAVYETAKKNGFNTIHNLSGHQIGRYDLHCGLSVPNLDNGNQGKIENNIELAIEPFVTYGQPMIKACRLSNILHLKGEGAVRDPIARKVLKHIRENFPHLPFSKRWLVESILKSNLKGLPTFSGFELRKVNYAVQILKKYGILYEYDELGTVDGEIVAQFEDTVVFINDCKTIITRA